jgi:hypothetical protein
VLWQLAAAEHKEKNLKYPNPKQAGKVAATVAS